jgi:hypothetical protein
VRDVDAELLRPIGRAELRSPDTYAQDVVASALDLEPVVTAAWLASVADGDSRGRRLVELDFGFVESLLIALLNRDDRRAGGIVESLERPNRYFVQRNSQLLALPFQARATEAARLLLVHLLDRATNDDLLSLLSRAASEHGREGWLQSVAAEVATDGMAVERARAIALAGLRVATPELVTSLRTAEERERSWTAQVATWARQRASRDLWARHWFRQFLSVPLREDAWAAFNLFARSADRRCGLWVHEELGNARDLPHHRQRHRHFLVNLPALNRRLEDQAKLMQERLFGWPIAKADLRPWKETWNLRHPGSH